MADQPQMFPAGGSWSYSNTGYVLAGLIVEAVTGHSLGDELDRRIFRPLRLQDTDFPVNFPFLTGPHASGYSLDLDDDMKPIEGPLLDLTGYNPSSLWAAGNIVSNQQDLARFFRALFGGRLLSAPLLAEMQRPVEIAPGWSYGLGLYSVDTPCGALFGHTGGAPGFQNWLFNSQDGSHQAGVMINADEAPAAASELFTTVAVEQGIREAFSGQPCAAGEPGDPAAVVSDAHANGTQKIGRRAIRTGLELRAAAPQFRRIAAGMTTRLTGTVASRRVVLRFASTHEPTPTRPSGHRRLAGAQTLRRPP